MEHVTFLIEESGTLIRCLLNPETLVVRRLAGIRTRQPIGGRQAGAGRLDDLISFTGGGRTELELDLLFDIDLPGSSPPAENVRDLTGPIWELAENSAESQGVARPPQVRFLWGKSWNIPGVVLAIAERFESFTPTGVPRRSWLRMRFLRVSDTLRPETGAQSEALPSRQTYLTGGESAPGSPAEASHIYHPFNAAKPVENKPNTSLPGLVDPNQLLFQVLQDSQKAQEALKEASRAIDALAQVATNAKPPLNEALNTAVQEMQTAMQSMAAGTATSTPSSETIQSPAAAAVQIVTAKEKALAQLPEVERGVQKAIVDKTLDPVLTKLRQAQAEVVDQALKLAATITFAAADTVAQISSNVAVALAQFPSGLHPFGTGSAKFREIRNPTAVVIPELHKALREITSAAKIIGKELDSAPVRSMADMVDSIAPQLNRVWTKSNARHARQAMQSLALSIHNLQAAEAVRKAVSTGALLAEATDDLRNRLQQLFDSPSDVEQDSVRNAVRRVEAIAHFEQSRPDGNSASLAITTQIRQGLETFGDPEKKQEAANTIQTALENLSEQAKAHQNDESAQAAEIVRPAGVQTRSEETIFPDEWSGTTERLDQIAYRHYGSPAYWRLLAEVNQIDNPLKLAPDQPLVIPPLTRVQTP